MSNYAVHNLFAKPIAVEDDRSYSVSPDGPRYSPEPLTLGDGFAMFDTYEEAEAWRIDALVKWE